MADFSSVPQTLPATYMQTHMEYVILIEDNSTQTLMEISTRLSGLGISWQIRHHSGLPKTKAQYQLLVERSNVKEAGLVADYFNDVYHAALDELKSDPNSD
jgi:hypothetical protein